MGIGVSALNADNADFFYGCSCSRLDVDEPENVCIPPTQTAQKEIKSFVIGHIFSPNEQYPAGFFSPAPELIDEKRVAIGKGDGRLILRGKLKDNGEFWLYKDIFIRRKIALDPPMSKCTADNLALYSPRGKFWVIQGRTKEEPKKTVKRGEKCPSGGYRTRTELFFPFIPAGEYEVRDIALGINGRLLDVISVP